MKIVRTTYSFDVNDDIILKQDINDTWIKHMTPKTKLKNWKHYEIKIWHKYTMDYYSGKLCNSIFYNKMDAT